MGDTEKCNTEMMQRLHSSFGSTTSSSSSIPKSLNQNQHQLELNPNFINRSAQFSQFSQQSPFSDSGNNSKRIGVLPPTSPYSQIPTTRPGFNPGQGPTPTPTHHSRSMSQPNSFFSFDSLPPLSPSPFLRNNDSADVSMEDNNREFTNPSSFLPPSSSSQFTRCNSTTTSSSSLLPPRKSHRRSSSDNIPNVFNNSMMIQNSIPPRPLERSISGGECGDWSKTSPFVKKESSSSCEREGVGEKESMDDLFSAYMNLDNIDVLNSSEADDSKNENNESSRASGTKTNGGSDTEGESSSVNESGNGNNNLNSSSGGDKKRRAGGGDIAPTSRHFRSVSVDSCFMEKLSSFGDEISSLKPPPSPGSLSRKVSPTNSVDGGNSAGFSIEFKNGEFTAAEMKKIMGNDKLAEMAMSDPKRVKRILANRQSAARSKERKMRYIVELEHKVQTLQTEATTLSAQLTLLQRDMMGLTNQNNELKFRLQAMEQQARLRDALNEALNGEVQRLKLAIGEANQNESDRSTKMQSLNAEMFQQLNISQLRPQQSQSQAQSQSQQNQNGTMTTTKPESNE